MTIPIYIQLLVLIIAVIIHEVSHGWIAYRLGDPTAKLMGRLTLNPLVHIDKYGSIMVPLLLILINSPFIFGWAKPVPFDPYNLKNPKRDSAIISIAGPISNIILAILSALLLRVILSPFLPYVLLVQFLLAMVYINIILAVFNLLPIHPLDGGKILVGILPEKDSRKVDQFLTRYGMFLLFFMIVPIFGGTSVVSLLITPVLSFVLGILVPGNPLV